MTALVRGAPPPHRSERRLLFAARVLDAVALTEYPLAFRLRAEDARLELGSGLDGDAPRVALDKGPKPSAVR